MSGKSGIRNLSGMRGRRKGGRKQTVVTPCKPGSIHAEMEKYLVQLNALGHSASSINTHRWSLKNFVEWAEREKLEHPSKFDRKRVEAYQLYLHEYSSPRTGQSLGINTQLARLGCVRRFFAWMCKSDIIPANPAADLDLPRKQARRIPKSLSRSEIDTIFAKPNVNSPFGLRDRTILELFYATGIRRSEMVNLDIGDYDSHTRTLIIRLGKGGKDRVVPVGERAAKWVDRYLAESRPLFDHLPSETALFMTGYGSRYSSLYLGNWVKKLMVSCGINRPGSCHLFRHSCATDMHRGGADIRYVQKMLGHERMETTQIYTHVNIESLRDIHNRCHPHGELGARDMYGRPPEEED